MENYDKLIKAQKIVIKQYAYGTVRIDDGYTINSHGGGGGGGDIAKGTLSPFVAFGVIADMQANGNIVPTIFLPPKGTLVLNGKDVPVRGAGAQQAQSIYAVTPGSSLWCVLFLDDNGNYAAEVMDEKDVNNVVALYRFPVAFVPKDLKRNRVKQYAYGTVFLYLDDGGFNIKQDSMGSSGSSSSLGAALRAIGDGDSGSDSDSGESSEEDYPAEPDYDSDIYYPTYHFSDGYYLKGNKLMHIDLSQYSVESFAGQFVCLKIPATADTTEDPSIVGYDSLSAVQEAQDDPAYVVKPLYKLNEEASVEVDFRAVPSIQVAEVF